MAAEYGDARKRLEEAIRRAEEDDAYAEELRSDPAGALRDAGLDVSAPEALAGRRPVDEALIPYWPCNDFTCWTSRCPGTCYITFCHTTWWLERQ